MLNYIVHILIDFMYGMPDFVLTIIILTLPILPAIALFGLATGNVCLFLIPSLVC
jgi:hypothetical protein